MPEEHPTETRTDIRTGTKLSVTPLGGTFYGKLALHPCVKGPGVDLLWRSGARGVDPLGRIIKLNFELMASAPGDGCGDSRSR